MKPVMFVSSAFNASITSIVQWFGFNKTIFNFNVESFKNNISILNRFLVTTSTERWPYFRYLTQINDYFSLLHNIIVLYYIAKHRNNSIFTLIAVRSKNPALLNYTFYYFRLTKWIDSILNDVYNRLIHFHFQCNRRFVKITAKISIVLHKMRFR